MKKMKTRLLVIFSFIGLLSLHTLIPSSDTSRVIMSLEEMITRSDAIVIGPCSSWGPWHVLIDGECKLP